jgi:DNA replication protein DnaC
MSDLEPVRAPLVVIAERMRRKAAENPEPIVYPESPSTLTRADRWMTRVWPRFSTATVDDVAPAAREHLAGWVTKSFEQSVGGVILTGEVGSGKTHTAVALAREMFLAGRSVEMWATVDLLDALRPEGDETVKSLASVDVLLLDDVGAERPTEWVSERMYALINRRWLYERPTICTTNLELDELQMGLGARAASRLLHDALVVHVGGADRRLSV